MKPSRPDIEARPWHHKAVNFKTLKYIYNGILLSHKKKQNWVICSEVDGPRVCHTEWSKSEKEKQIPYANTYIWNLKKKKKWY